jgi:hypothetical protein
MTAPRGFASLALLLLLAAGTSILALALPGLVASTQQGRLGAAAARMRTAATTAREIYVRDGTFPNDLAQLAAAGLLDANGNWQVDPFGGRAPLDYRSSGAPATARVASRGPDARLGTADDLIETVGENAAARARMRARLRTLRAAVARSQFLYSPMMTAADRASMRSALRTWAKAQRSLLGADPAAKASLTANRDAAAATIAALRATYALPPWPARVTGAGGLLQALSLPDSLGSDGFGQAFVIDASVGVRSIGGDRTPGGDDDV